MDWKNAGIIGLLVVIGCGGTGRNVSDTTSYNVISRSEIEAAVAKKSMQNAFEVIRFLRPRYLTPRSQPSVNQGVIVKDPIIYLNNVRYGTSTQELQNIYYDQIMEIAYLKGREATHRFGMGHEGGAILIKTR